MPLAPNKATDSQQHHWAIVRRRQQAVDTVSSEVLGVFDGCRDPVDPMGGHSSFLEFLLHPLGHDQPEDGGTKNLVSLACTRTLRFAGDVAAVSQNGDGRILRKGIAGQQAWHGLPGSGQKGVGPRSINE